MSTRQRQISTVEIGRGNSGPARFSGGASGEPSAGSFARPPFRTALSASRNWPLAAPLSAARSAPGIGPGPATDQERLGSPPSADLVIFKTRTSPTGNTRSGGSFVGAWRELTIRPAERALVMVRSSWNGCCQTPATGRGTTGATSAYYRFLQAGYFSLQATVSQSASSPATDHKELCGSGTL